MSYGWQTESTINPAPAEKIELKNKSGLLGVEAAIKASKQASVPSKPSYKTPSQRNKGIQDRMAKDLLLNPTLLSTDPKSLSLSLQKKSHLYQKLQQQGYNLKDSLIDFLSKKIQSDDSYQDIRKQFYEEKMSELQRSAKQDSELISEEERDRVNWEKRMLGEMLIGGKSEKVKVRQSYDMGLTEQEQRALKEVLKEQGEEKERLEVLKRKGRELKEDRIQKLRKMNIIKTKTVEVPVEKPKEQEQSRPEPQGGKPKEQEYPHAEPSNS